jgi:hypothetical protein
MQAQSFHLVYFADVMRIDAGIKTFSEPHISIKHQPETFITATVINHAAKGPEVKNLSCR